MDQPGRVAATLEPWVHKPAAASVPRLFPGASIPCSPFDVAAVQTRWGNSRAPESHFPRGPGAARSSPALQMRLRGCPEAAGSVCTRRAPCAARAAAGAPCGPPTGAHAAKPYRTRLRHPQKPILFRGCCYCAPLDSIVDAADGVRPWAVTEAVS